MLYVIKNTVLTFSVIYTFIAFIKWILCIISAKEETCEKLYVVIRVRNQEGAIEGVIRNIILKYLKISNGEFVPNIIIVDTGSSDSTAEICKKLSEDYSFIYYVNEKG